MPTIISFILLQVSGTSGDIDPTCIRSNGQVGRTTASACACTEITLRTSQDSKALRQKAMAQGHLVPMRRFNVVSPRANRGATLGAIARGFSSHKRTSISHARALPRH